MINYMEQSKQKDNKEINEMVLNYLRRMPPSYRDGAYLMVYFLSNFNEFDVDLVYKIWNICNTYYKDNELCKIHVVNIADVIHSNLIDRFAYEKYRIDKDVANYFKNITVENIKNRLGIVIPTENIILIKELAIENCKSYE